jgi:hypothetical protein
MLSKKTTIAIIIVLIVTNSNINSRIVNPGAAARAAALTHQTRIISQAKQEDQGAQVQQQPQDYNLDYSDLDAGEYSQQLLEELSNYNDPNNQKPPAQHHRRKHRKDPSQLKPTHDHLTSHDLDNLAEAINKTISNDSDLLSIMQEIVKIKDQKQKAEKEKKVIQLVNTKIAEVAEDDPYNLSESSVPVQNAQKKYDSWAMEVMSHHDPLTITGLFKVGLKDIIKYGGEFMVLHQLYGMAKGSDKEKEKEKSEEKDKSKDNMELEEYKKEIREKEKAKERTSKDDSELKKYKKEIAEKEKSGAKEQPKKKTKGQKKAEKRKKAKERKREAEEKSKQEQEAKQEELRKTELDLKQQELEMKEQVEVGPEEKGSAYEETSLLD